ncbi:MAG: hypothetical protein IIC53_02810 [Proteobacteria bacterium]|nr:hypothetical protein [Pseudomonadota bacterium]
MDKFVHVKFHPGLNRAAVEGEITESETFGPHLQSIKVSEGGYIHDICMGDVESITEVSTGTKLWESKRTRSPGPKFNVKVHVSTTIAGTAVRTGDSVEVRTDNGRATGRYVGILTAVNATDIGVEATHGTDYIPIDIIKRIIVTYSPGFAKGGLVQGGATHLASYPNLPGSWGVKEEPGDWLDDIASQLKIPRKQCRLLFAFGYPRGLGNIKLPIDLPHYPFMPEK